MTRLVHILDYNPRRCSSLIVNIQATIPVFDMLCKYTSVIICHPFYCHFQAPIQFIQRPLWTCEIGMTSRLLVAYIKFEVLPILYICTLNGPHCTCNVDDFLFYLCYMLSQYTHTHAKLLKSSKNFFEMMHSFTNKILRFSFLWGWGAVNRDVWEVCVYTHIFGRSRSITFLKY